MGTLRILSAALILFFVAHGSAFSQIRDLRAQRLIIDDSLGNTIKMQTSASGLTSYTLTWPLTAGTNNYVLVTNGANGVLSWKSVESISNGWGLNGNTLTGTEVLGSLNGQPLVMITNGSERLRVTALGNVGLGNTNPLQKLQVSGNILVDSAHQVQFQNPAGTFATTFQAGAQTGNINYTLPLASPVGNGYLLSSTTGGAMSWVNPLNAFVFQNGLTISNDTVRLGGPLTGTTNIALGTNNFTISNSGDAGNIIFGKFTTSGIIKNSATGILSSGRIALGDTTEVTGTLGIINGGTNNNVGGSAGQVLYYDGTKYNFTSTGTTGQILQSNNTGAPTWINVGNLVKANNGVSLLGDTVQLGGTLTKNTSIPFGTNNLTLSAVGNTGDIIIGKFATKGIVKNSAAGVLSTGKLILSDTTEVTGTLGIANGGTNNTTIGGAGSVAYSDGSKYVFSSTGTNGQILQLNSSVPTWTNISSIVKANNGLSMSADTVQLGGTLIKNAIISQDGFNVIFEKSGTGNVQLTNTNNSANQLRFYEPNSNGGSYTSFRAGPQTFDINYMLPTVGPTTGQILSSTVAGVMSWTSIGSLVNANNGVSLSGDTVQLGGTLTKNTSIPFGTNNLTLSAVGNTGDIIIGKFATKGIVKNSATGVLSTGKLLLGDTTEVTGTLGIINGGTNNNVGGSAGQVLYYDGTKYNFTSTGTTGQILQSNNTGAPTWINVGNLVKANNGVSLSGDTVQLGGTLTKNTSIPFGTNNLTLSAVGNTGD
ncbi:MAG: hypothetical protein HYZ44_10160, partial [Bacteroidetes bacterium]|nr:hypothetical protein [Bacteroidota bacterium]